MKILTFIGHFFIIILTEESLKVIEDSAKEVARKMDKKILELSGASDHVHCLIEYPPKLAISLIVNTIKGVSSRMYGEAGFSNALWKKCIVEF